METRHAAASSSSGTAANRAEAERLLGVAEKLLQNRDLNGCRDFAVLAQETEPLLDGSDQILAVAEVLLASEKRINNHNDWYAILQIDRRADDLDLIKKQYRRLALLLHPDKNKFAFSDSAFKLVADAWAVLNDSAKKSLYDNELTLFSKIDLVSLRNERSAPPHHQNSHHPPPPPQHQDRKLPVRRSARGGRKKPDQEVAGEAPTATTPASAVEEDNNKEKEQAEDGSFWTACPYCYRLFEYPKAYEGCCLRCQNCRRAFHGVLIPSLPPLVPGKDAYYCCWGFFPMGFTSGNSEGKSAGEGFPNWMPPIFPNSQPNGAVPAPP